MSPKSSSPRLSLLICIIYASTKSACSFITNTVNQLQPPTVTTIKPRSSTAMIMNSMLPSSHDCCSADDDKKPFHHLGKITNGLGKATLIALTSATLIASSPVVSFADEIGREVEAPTLFTGESVEICVKRGPLGACQKTEIRTEDNDNDKATKYFKGKDKTILAGGVEDESDLLTNLRQKTEDNRERNEQAVRIKTFENNQAANFGPFDRQVVILNTDGKTFTLLQNPQAMRLKKAGYIEGRKFVKQPSAEVLEGALESEEGLGDLIKGFFGDK